MPDSSPVIDSAQLQQQGGAVLSAETILAIRKYNQEVASYTLRQWNVAKIESERKERDRRKRRADALLAQRAASAANTPPGTSPASVITPNGTVSKVGGHGLGSARAGSRTSDRSYHHHHHHYHHHAPPDSDGPLMMVSRRKTDRALSGTTSIAGPPPVPFGQRHSHDGRYPPNNTNKPSYQVHDDLVAIEHHHHRPTAHHHSSVSAPGSRLHTRSYQAASSSVHAPGTSAPSTTFLDPNSNNGNIGAAIAAQAHHYQFDRPATQHIESVAIGLSGDLSEEEEDNAEEEPLITPPRSWQRRPSGSTPPIPIPAPRQYQQYQSYQQYHHSHPSSSHSQRSRHSHHSPPHQQGAGLLLLSGSSAASSALASISSPPGSSVNSRSSSLPSSSSRHSPPARALGYSAHLGMTSISQSAGGSSGLPSTSTSVITDSTSSSSNPTSEGSSRISSFSESTLRQSLKKEEDAAAIANANASASSKERNGRPKAGGTHGTHGPSKGGSVNAVEGAIGTLRRMTISEEEESVLGPLDHH